jgi:DNA-directed RNA polymerase subunit M/transcription elongation factor TFIIS
MALTLTCTNRGCGDIQEPYLDKETGKVFCSSCDRELPNVSNISKNQMKMNKQFKTRKKDGFAVKCPACSSFCRPKLGEKDVLVCSNCGKALEKSLSPAFATMLREKLQEKDD